MCLKKAPSRRARSELVYQQVHHSRLRRLFPTQSYGSLRDGFGFFHPLAINCQATITCSLREKKLSLRPVHKINSTALQSPNSRTSTRTKGGSTRRHADTSIRRHVPLYATRSPTITVSLRYRRSTLLNTLNASELTSLRQTKLRRSTAFRDVKLR
jgi:hypothetical protein